MIEQGDIIEWCKSYTGEKFHAVLCDPPYELGFMGKSWDSTGIAFDKETWRSISRHLYPGAYLLAFGGTRTFHRIAVAIEDAGFEIRDTVMWVYGSGFPKSHNVGKAVDKAEGNEREVVGAGTDYGHQEEKAIEQKFGFKAEYNLTKGSSPWEGYGTALKPSWEPVIIARLPLEGTVAQNTQKYGSGALNIDGCRVGTEGGGTHCDNRDENGKCKGHDNAGRSTSGETFHGPDTQGGRWPANLIHDGSDEVVGMFPGEEGKSAARFFYSAKVSKRERDAGLEHLEVKRRETRTETGAGSWEEKGPQPARNNHPTLKPISLTTYLAKLILPPKLDKPRRLLVPFAGSGSEVIGGLLAGWDEVVGVEREKEYVEIAKARINHWTKQPSSQSPSSSSTSVQPESTDTQETFGI
jgi:site-specific DNA-methyltransferase (adenine-specific)